MAAAFLLDKQGKQCQSKAFSLVHLRQHGHMCMHPLHYCHLMVAVNYCVSYVHFNLIENCSSLSFECFRLPSTLTGAEQQRVSRGLHMHIVDELLVSRRVQAAPGSPCVVLRSVTTCASYGKAASISKGMSLGNLAS